MHVPYSGYFSGVKFSWFSWLRGEPQNILPTKQYCIVLGCGLVYRDHEHFLRTGQKFTAHENFTPEKYPLYGILCLINMHVHIHCLVLIGTPCITCTHILHCHENVLPHVQPVPCWEHVGSQPQHLGRCTQTTTITTTTTHLLC